METFDTPLLQNKKRTFYIWPDNHGCPAEAEARTKNHETAILTQTEQDKLLHRQTITAAGLTGWLTGASFDNYEARPDWPAASDNWQRVWDYLSALLGGSMGEKNWLVLYGSYGMGKSHLAAAAVHEAINAGWKGCYFRVWPEYLKRLQFSWNRPKDDDGSFIGESEADITEEFQRGKLIVIDDLDKREPSDWSRSVLYTALNHRYNNGLPTILTFNYGPEDADPKAPGRLALEKYLGGAVFDRLIQQTFDVIEFNGPSYRSGVKLSPSPAKVIR